METKPRLKPKQMQVEIENLKKEIERLVGQLIERNNQINFLTRENTVQQNKLETIGKLL